MSSIRRTLLAGFFELFFLRLGNQWKDTSWSHFQPFLLISQPQKKAQKVVTSDPPVLLGVSVLSYFLTQAFFREGRLVAG